jgi:hypothetical protein
MIKGRVAEAIIKELFQANGYRVYDYGMERTLPEAIENVKNRKDEMAFTIKHMPDFLVQHINSGELESGRSLPDKKYDIKNCNRFSLNKALVELYKGYAKTFFEGVK